MDLSFNRNINHTSSLSSQKYVMSASVLLRPFNNSSSFSRICVQQSTVYAYTVFRKGIIKWPESNLEDCRVDVDDDHGGQGHVHEGRLPQVSVHLVHKR